MVRRTEAQSFDSFAADYDRFVSLAPRQNTGWLADLGLSGGRAVDVGCGSGHAAELLADSFDEVLAVDVSAPLLDIARRRRAGPRVRYLRGDVLELSDDVGFDLVYSHTMMHHVPDYRAGLERLRALVRPGGTVAVIDNVRDRGPTPPRRAYTWPARWNFPAEARRLGVRDAWFTLRFWHDRRWLAHLSSDRYLSRRQFRDVYGAVFPGARFDDLGFALGMVWVAPDRPSSR